MLDAGDRIAIARRAAGRDQDIGCAHAIAVRQLHGVGVDKHGAAFGHFDAGFVERGAVSRFEPGNLAILVGDHVAQSNDICGTVQPKPAASSNSPRNRDA